MASKDAGPPSRAEEAVSGPAQSVASLNSGLGVQVKDNSEAVRAMDANRLAVNKRLVALEKALANVRQQVEANGLPAGAQ